MGSKEYMVIGVGIALGMIIVIKRNTSAYFYLLYGSALKVDYCFTVS